MTPPRPDAVRRRWRRAGAALLPGSLWALRARGGGATGFAAPTTATPRTPSLSATATDVQVVATAAMAARRRGPLRDGSLFVSAAQRRAPSRRLVVRRIFDTGSFFGVGLPEAVVVALLSWFLLGPQELFRLSKQVGNWLGELRTFVAQAAQQYETALNDESTRKAIQGIRETQKTVAEVSAQWGSVAEKLRDPLNLKSAFSDSFDRIANEPVQKESEKTEEKKAKAEASEGSSKNSKPVPDLTSGEPEPLEEETPEELERKRAMSREMVKDMWHRPDKERKDDSAAPSMSPERYLRRLDMRLEELDNFAMQLKEMRESLEDDREVIKGFVAEAAAAKEAAAGGDSTGASPQPAEDKAEAAEVSAGSSASAQQGIRA